jgi:cytochrome c peroxidase
MSKRVLYIGFIIGYFFSSCEKDIPLSNGTTFTDGNGPSPYYLAIPDGFGEYRIPESNLLTKEGVELGRRLFYEPLLSRNKNVSCGTCHKQANAFTDPLKLSLGTNGDESAMHSMALFNLAWQPHYFWNGREKTLEGQALKPVVNPLEMDMTWPEVESRLNSHSEYPGLFQEALGTDVIDSNLVTSAIAQFEYTIVSADSKWDRYLRNEVELSPMEEKGRKLFVGLESGTGDCTHCHSDINPHIGDFFMRNNGLDSDEDLKSGFSEVTGLSRDFGKFKTPSLRNLAFSAPYMHDGRFENLRDVLDFYSEEVHFNRTVDPLMEFANEGGVQLSEDSKDALIAFLLTMSDSSLVTNPDYSDPNK